MLPAGAPPFRQLSRPGDEAVAAGDLAQRLQGGIRPAQPCSRCRRSSTEEELAADDPPLWQEPQPSPEAELLRRHDDEAIRRLVASLPQPFRETIVLRDINDLSYRDIAEVLGVPVGTVMSRLARARAMLRARWTLEQGSAP